MGSARQFYDSHLKEFQSTADVKSQEEYQILYRRSLEDNDDFWSEKARQYLIWEKEWDFVHRYDPEEARIEWFGGGILNATSNCLDRHLERLQSKVAYHWEGENPSDARVLTYGGLYNSVNKFAAVLKSRGIAKGDCVLIYLPTIIELPTAMLACARIGAVHCVVCTGYGAQIVADRIRRCRAKAVVTADGYYESGSVVPLKKRVDEALKRCPDVETVVVVRRCGSDIQLDLSTELWWHESINDLSLPDYVVPEPMNAEDPLFMLFAARAIGEPIPLVHTHGGYLLWAAMTSRLVFDLKEENTFWSTSDMSWISGHTFSVYGPLINGSSVVLFEGNPSHSGSARLCQIVVKHQVDKFCTGATAIRTMAVADPCDVETNDLSSLRILGTADEHVSAREWEWFYHHIGRGRCPIMVTWFQAESGGPIMTPLPGVSRLKPGSVCSPFFGVEPEIIDLDTGETARFPNQEGAFIIGRPWPGMARTVFGDHDAFREAYYELFPGFFVTGQGAKRDDDGLYWMTGRIDDVINIGGHRVGTWEIESALVNHPRIAEATVVGLPHPIKGQGLYAFITLIPGTEKTEALRQDLVQWLRDNIGTIAIPDVIQWVPELPKTRSGKILRRLLQKIAEGNVKDLGDMSTVANPDIVVSLIRDRISLSL